MVNEFNRKERAISDGLRVDNYKRLFRVFFIKLISRYFFLRYRIIFFYYRFSKLSILYNFSSRISSFTALICPFITKNMSPNFKVVFTDLLTCGLRMGKFYRIKMGRRSRLDRGYSSVLGEKFCFFIASEGRSHRFYRIFNYRLSCPPQPGRSYKLSKFSSFHARDPETHFPPKTASRQTGPQEVSNLCTYAYACTYLLGICINFI